MSFYLTVIGIYLAFVAIATIAVLVMTSDRYRDRFSWFVMDDPEERP